MWRRVCDELDLISQQLSCFCYFCLHVLSIVDFDWSKTSSFGRISKMSDDTPKEAELLPTKRNIKLTSKGLCFFMEMSQEKRSVKCKQAKDHCVNGIK